MEGRGPEPGQQAIKGLEPVVKEHCLLWALTILPDMPSPTLYVHIFVWLIMAQELVQGLVRWISGYKCLPLLSQPGKNKASTTILEPNLKQALLKTGQDHGCWPDPYLEFPEYGSKLH